MMNLVITYCVCWMLGQNILSAMKAGVLDINSTCHFQNSLFPPEENKM